MAAAVPPANEPNMADSYVSTSPLGRPFARLVFKYSQSGYLMEQNGNSLSINTAKFLMNLLKRPYKL